MQCNISLCTLFFCVDAKSQPWSPSMSESNVMSPLTYPDWTEWSRSQAPEAWDQSLPLAADESYTNPRPYVNAPWYEGTDDKSVQPVQNVVNGDVVPQYPEDHKVCHIEHPDQFTNVSL